MPWRQSFRLMTWKSTWILGYLVISTEQEESKATFRLWTKRRYFRAMAARSFILFVLMTHSFAAVSNAWCTGDSDCGSDQGKVCCNNECVYGSDCVGQSCTFNSDCSSGESCCSSICKYGDDCVGYSCSFDSDCKRYHHCCYGYCSDSDCTDPTAVILGSIFGSLVVIFLISMCIFFACRRRRTAHYGTVIVGQRVTATTTTTRSATQSNPLYPGQVPPSYQQGYPYYPPPQYEQHQTNVPPPYNAGNATASEQPPPYTGGPQGTSGGVYAPKPSYGAVPSAPPV